MQIVDTKGIFCNKKIKRTLDPKNPSKDLIMIILDILPEDKIELDRMYRELRKPHLIDKWSGFLIRIEWISFELWKNQWILKFQIGFYWQLKFTYPLSKIINIYKVGRYRSINSQQKEDKTWKRNFLNY